METNFPNGFQSYIETFFHISTIIANHLNENWNKPEVVTVIKIEQDGGGHFALCELAKDWTLEFEEKYKGEEWTDYDWYDTLEAFCETKNKL